MTLIDKITSLGYEAIAIAGPTASGKTGLSVELARRLDTEIISCDSMQIYRGMDIGTAKATEQERSGILHHMLDICDLCESYSAADYVRDATAAARDMISRGKLPVFCGGTGLYLEGVMRGGYPECADTDTALRDSLAQYATEHGNEALHDMLRSIDPASADAIHPNNVKRVIRAIEIAKCSGSTKSELDSRHCEFGGLKIFVVCLNYSDRELLYRRIERRVDMMVEDGLCEELSELLGREDFLSNKTALQAIGYKELFPYMRGEGTLPDCIQTLKTATRRYAKRQLTWFLNKDYVRELICDDDGRVKSAAELADEFALFFE